VIQASAAIAEVAAVVLGDEGLLGYAGPLRSILGPLILELDDRIHSRRVYACDG